MTPSAEAFYMAEGRLVASGTINVNPQVSKQVAYFCTTCGKVWGQLLIPEAQSWEVIPVPCRKHKPQGVSDWRTIPGSFIQRKFRASETSTMDWARCLEIIPNALVKYEFLLTLDQESVE